MPNQPLLLAWKSHKFIFQHVFTDELVRQVTLNCVEQGLLLLRVRDEMRMTCRTYQVLYESAIAFGLRKLLQVKP